MASRLHLHPDCEIVDLVSQTARIRAPGGDFYVAFAGRGRLGVEKSAYCLGPFGPDTELPRFGQKLAERGGKAAKKRAVVAVAHKLAVLLHRLWVTGEEYQAIGYGQSTREAA